MKKFVTETVEVLLPAQKPDSGSGRGYNGGAAAFRYALMALLALGLLGVVGQAQEPLVIGPTGDVSVAKTLSVAGNVGIGAKITGWPLTIQGTGGNSDWLQFTDSAGKQRYHINFAGGGFNLVETGIKDYRLFIQAGTGNVGIGTNETPSKLNVAGNANFSGDVGIGGILKANQAIITTLQGTYPAGPNFYTSETKLTIKGDVNVEKGIQAESINGERPPLHFTIASTRTAPGTWNTVVVDIRDLCGDEDGCRIKVLMTGGQNIRGLIDEIYIFSDLQGLTDQCREKTIDEYVWQLGTGDKSKGTLFEFWDWVKARNYIEKGFKKVESNESEKEDKFFQGAEKYKIAFSCNSHVSCSFFIYDR